MSILSITNRLSVLIITLLLVACGGSDSNASKVTEEKQSSGILNTKCDKIIDEYDRLVSKSIEFTKAGINGEEIDEAEQEQITKDAKALAEKIQKLGLVGLGGQHCYDEFVKIQMKWSEAFVELQQKAIEEAMKKVQENQ